MGIWIVVLEDAPWAPARARCVSGYEEMVNATIGTLPRFGPKLSTILCTMSPYDYTNGFLKMPSNLLAMYHLVLLFERLLTFEDTAAILEPLRPISKLLAIKAIVFLSLWQEKAIH